MKIYTTILFCLIGFTAFAQDAALIGLIHDADGQPALFANVALYAASDSSLAKVETTNETGIFRMEGLTPDNYFLKATYVGSPDLVVEVADLKQNEQRDLGLLTFDRSAIELAEATVKASRAMVEVKSDRTVFNVQGTINSTGSDAISLLRMAPGVAVDNNDNINVLGRSGVLLYVDGKRLPLTGDDLTNYLRNLPADQIDRIDIISNPGAKYEAEGNAGIIDVRLRKDDSHGGNGTVSGTWSQGRYGRANLNASGNYRNKVLNAFASGGLGTSKGFNDMYFENVQNGISLTESVEMINERNSADVRAGIDVFFSPQHTIGVLVNSRRSVGESTSSNRNLIATIAAPSAIDSILVAQDFSNTISTQQSYNLNYRFDNGKGRSLNVDFDYGLFSNDAERLQPNRYFDAEETVVLTEVINSFDTPSDIEITTAKADFEDGLWNGQFAAGVKLSRVVSENTFLFYDVINTTPQLNDRSSNLFDYEENVYAAYVNYSRQVGESVSISAGLRAEQTDATGSLQAFLPDLQEPPVEFNYLSWFPSAGLSWRFAPQHTLAVNYGRRINRPDYNVLNPFNNRLSELSFEKGNPFLRPEIVNNLELGLTLAYRYNFKVAYSRTTDQITRLMAPDENDPRAGFITWDNLASQDVFSFNLSAPVQVVPGWSAYVNLSASHINNQADYGDGAVVDLQAFTYSIYQQSTFDLPAGLKGEISGYFSGPGVWGGVFEYESNWSLNLGLQRKFLDDRLNVRLAANDIFYQTGWDGTSFFDGMQVNVASGRWDSRRVSLSLTWDVGNTKVTSRKRKTGIESEASRVGS